MGIANRPFYAGIGARHTPQDVRSRMYSIGRTLANAGFVLRSGHALGADQAFEFGCSSVGGAGEIFTTHYLRPSWFHVAEEYHPAWNKCSDAAKALHARNSAVILGANLLQPVRFVVCWTLNAKVKGGTGQSLRIAKGHDIPVINLCNDPTGNELETFLGIKIQ